MTDRQINQPTDNGQSSGSCREVTHPMKQRPGNKRVNHISASLRWEFIKKRNSPFFLVEILFIFFFFLRQDLVFFLFFLVKFLFSFLFLGRKGVFFLFFLKSFLYKFFFSWSTSCFLSFYLGQKRTFFLVILNLTFFLCRMGFFLKTFFINSHL